MRYGQRGVFMMARALLLVGILLTMLIIPVWIKRGNDDKMNAGTKAEQAKNAGATATGSKPTSSSAAASESAQDSATVATNAQTPETGSAAPAGAPRPMGHGPTFALAPVSGKANWGPWQPRAFELPRRAATGGPAAPGFMQSLQRRYVVPGSVAGTVLSRQGLAATG